MFKARWVADQFSHRERGAVPAQDSPVQSRDPVSGPEVQVGSSAAEDFNELTAVLQLHGQGQRTLWRTQRDNLKSRTSNSSDASVLKAELYVIRMLFVCSPP